MAFTLGGLYIDKGGVNNAVPSSVFSHHRYQNIYDNLSVISTTGYFPDYLGVGSESVKIGDLIDIRASNDYRTYKITSVSPITLVEEVMGDNPFNQSLNTTNNVGFAGVNISGLTASQAVVTDASKNLASMPYSSTNTVNALIRRDSSGNFSSGVATLTGATISTFSTGVVHSNGSGVLSSSTIVNADIDAAAGIVDTKLATISTAGKVSNSATTATSANTASSIVARDASGNFAASAITAASLTLPATGGTPTQMAEFEEGSFNVTFTGALSSVVTVYFQRLNKRVDLFFGSLTGVSLGANFISAAAGSVPARLAPDAALYAGGLQATQRNLSTNGGVFIAGVCLVDDDGSIIMGTDQAGTFSGAGTVGFYPFTITYKTA